MQKNATPIVNDVDFCWGGDHKYSERHIPMDHLEGSDKQSLTDNLRV